MGLEYHNDVKDSFHLRSIINIRKKKFGSSEIWTPVLWTKGQSWTHITSQPLHKKFSKTSKVIVQSNLIMEGDSKIQKLKNLKLVFEKFYTTKMSKNVEIVLVYLKQSLGPLL